MGCREEACIESLKGKEKLLWGIRESQAEERITGYSESMDNDVSWEGTFLTILEHMSTLSLSYPQSTL